MDAEGLKLKIDSKAAQQDLAGLEKSLDKVSAGAARLDAALTRTAASTSASLGRAAKSMERYAQVAALLSKIKISGSPVAQIRELGLALDSIGRARMISPEKVGTLRSLISALGTLRAPTRLVGVAELLNSLGAAKIPTAGSIARLKELFVVLGNAKGVPNATHIVIDLDNIAAAATRASKALRSMPNLSRNIGGGGSAFSTRSPVAAVGAGAAASSKSTNLLGNELESAGGKAKKANASFSLLSDGVSNLSGRMRIGYQVGTLMSLFFSSFTIAAFVKSIYDANIQLLKLQKAVLFSTGTFDGAAEATDKYIGMSQELGLSIKDNIETYGRFVIASKASNMSLDQTNSIYHAVGQAMTVVGSSAAQQQLAFYGLTEMMQKGVVYSKEFNRQIGAQLPGNAILGARALGNLEHRVVSVTEFFKRMHSGTLLSVDFVPAWAAEVEKMYHPLLALAQARPDVAVTRLKNAFFIFAKQVGDGKFMSSIGLAVTGLMNKFIVMDHGVAKLTPNAQKLADTLGHFLASSVQTLGKALGWVIDHFDLLMTALKVFATYKLAVEFMAWTAGAVKAATSIGKLATAILGLAKAEEKEAIASALVNKVKAATIASPVSTAITSFGRRTPTSAFGREAMGFVPAPRVPFGKRTFGLGAGAAEWEQFAKASARSTATAAPLEAVSGTALRAGLGYGAAEGATAAAAVGEGGVAAAATGAATALAGFTIVVGAAAAVLVAIRPAATGGVTDKGHNVLYSDVENSTFKVTVDMVMGEIDSIGNAFSSLGQGFAHLFGITTDGGQVMARFASMIMATVGLVVGSITTLFDFLVTIFAIIAKDVEHSLKAAWYNVTFRPEKAQAESAANDVDRAALWKRFGQNTQKGLFDAIDDKGIYNKIMGGAQKSADERAKTEKTADAAQKGLEASLRQQNAAAIIEAAAQRFSTAAIGMNQVTDKIDPLKLLADIKAFAAGNPSAGMSDAEKATLARSVGNQTITGVVGAGAARAGVDPNLLYTLGWGESHYDPKQYNWSPGHHAVGPFQMEPGAIAEMSAPQYGGAFDAHHLTEDTAYRAGVFLEKQIAAAEKILGHKVEESETFMPYKLGGAGGAKLINLNQYHPDDLATNSFSAAVTNGNHNLFYADKTKSKPLTNREVYANYANMTAGVGLDQGADVNPDNVSASAGGSAAGGMPDDKINRAADQSYKQVMSFIGEASPGVAAESAMQEKLISLKTLFQNVQKDQASSSPFSKTFLSAPSILDGISRAIDRMTVKQEEAQHPIAHLNTLSEDANKISELRAKGLNTEADYQGEVNKLLDEGYTRAEADDPKEKVRFFAAQARNDLLASQIDLTKELMDVELKRMTRLSNDPLQNAINAKIAAGAKTGESFEQARARQTASGQVDTYTSGASAAVKETDASARQQMTETIGELQAVYGLNASEKSMRDSYKTALQQMTGLSTDSLDRLNAAATADQKAFATSYSATLDKLQNPPGFQRWVDGLEPIAKRLEDIKATFAEDLSSGITDSLMGEKPDWTGMITDLRKQWMKSQVDNVMASTMGALGITQTATPEQTNMAAANTMQSSSVTFAQSVSLFGMSVTGLTGSPVAASAASAAASAAGTGMTSDDGLSGILRGSLDTGGVAASQQATQQALTTAVSGTASGASPSSPGFFGSIGNAFGIGGSNGTGASIGNGLLGLLGMFGGLLTPKPPVVPTYHDPNGIIGTMSTNTVSGTSQPGQANILGSLLNMVAQVGVSGATGGSSGGGFLSNLFNGGGGMGSTSNSIRNLFGAGLTPGSGIGELMSAQNPVGGSSGGIMDWLASLFNEGGYATQPVAHKLISARTFRDVPHFGEGTGNTSGIAAIVHPDEAVIPLSRNRKIPIEGGTGHVTNVSSNITVVTPNPDGFRKSTGAIYRDQNRTLKRAALRNLTGAL